MTNVSKFNYSNGKEHAVCFSDTMNNCFYFSYDTLVAFKISNGELYVHQNDWGVTTGKHLNCIDYGDKEKRLNDNEFWEEYKKHFETK